MNDKREEKASALKTNYFLLSWLYSVFSGPEFTVIIKGKMLISRAYFEDVTML